MRSFGFIESPLDSNDNIFKSGYSLESLPEDYVLKNVHPVVDQGEEPICAAISISHILDWQLSAKDMVVKDNNPEYIYGLRSDKSIEGMIPRDALTQLKRTGIGKYKIGNFSRIEDSVSAREAILTNGPVMACFRAYSGDAFWIPNGNQLGGHAVLLTGWEGNNFIMQNSWGTVWGNGGKAYFPDDEWKYVLECWTILI